MREGYREDGPVRAEGFNEPALKRGPVNGERSPFGSARMSLEDELGILRGLIVNLQEMLAPFVDPDRADEATKRIRAADEEPMPAEPKKSIHAAWMWGQVSTVRQLRDQVQVTLSSLDLG